MDCKALHVNSKNGQYWANAAQQVVHNQALGLLFLKIAVAPKSLINLSHLPSLPLSSFTTAAEQIKARSFFRVIPKFYEIYSKQKSNNIKNSYLKNSFLFNIF